MKSLQGVSTGARVWLEESPLSLLPPQPRGHCRVRRVPLCGSVRYAHRRRP